MGRDKHTFDLVLRVLSPTVCLQGEEIGREEMGEMRRFFVRKGRIWGREEVRVGGVEG